MDVSLNFVGQMPVKTRLQTDAILSFRVAGNLYTHSSAEGNHAVIDDAVINLHPLATLAHHPRLVERIQVLGHVGLGGVNFGQQLTHVFLTIAQRADDAKAHGRRHDTKHLSGFLKDLFRFGQDVVVNWNSFAHGELFKFLLLHDCAAKVQGGNDKVAEKIGALKSIAQLTQKWAHCVHFWRSFKPLKGSMLMPQSHKSQAAQGQQLMFAVGTHGLAILANMRA